MIAQRRVGCTAGGSDPPDIAAGAIEQRYHRLNTEHETTIFPGSDALIVTAAEQQKADERARSQIASVQAALGHHPTAE